MAFMKMPIQLAALLDETGNQDVTKAVDAARDRYYLGEDVAKELRDVVVPE